VARSVRIDAWYTAAVTFPPPTAFMPHRPPMLLVDRLLAHDLENVTIEKTFRAGELFVEGDVVSGFVVVELFAQAAAAHFGYAGLVAGGAFASGALLGTRKIDLAVPSLPIERRLEVRAHQVFAMPPAAQYDCTLLDVTDGETVLATGTINVAMGPPPPT
jgi:predicted hotdog family 3-hydroxylacyl-ACP dehydratase